MGRPERVRGGASSSRAAAWREHLSSLQCGCPSRGWRQPQHAAQLGPRRKNAAHGDQPGHPRPDRADAIACRKAISASSWATHRALPRGMRSRKFPPSERRRLAWHLPEDFRRRFPEDPAEILDWVRTVIISGSTDYRRYQAAAIRQRFGMRFSCAQGPRRRAGERDPDRQAAVVIDVPPRLNRDPRHARDGRPVLRPLPAAGQGRARSKNPQSGLESRVKRGCGTGRSPQLTGFGVSMW